MVRAVVPVTWRRGPRLRIGHKDDLSANSPVLAEHGFAWRMMDVHTSTIQLQPIYTPTFQTKYWQERMGIYRYGLGNFYSIDGCVTHYHNWFDRITRECGEINVDSQATLQNEEGLPVAYVRAYTRKFLADLENDALVIPDVGRGREAYATAQSCGTR